MPLNSSQLAAIDFVRRHALGRQDGARARSAEILEMSNVPPSRLEAAVEAIRKHARAGIHFHPDRLDGKARLVAESLLLEGIYKSQFATFISSGKVAPTVGGARDQWENRLFGNAYRGTNDNGADRPKYAGLDLMRLPDGPCPRFGSCYLLLKPRVLQRCTFSYRDSYLETLERGTLDCLDDIVSALLVDAFEREFALGIYGLRPDALIEHLIEHLRKPLADPSGKPPARNLDFYIESQVHGEVSLMNDVDALIADPSFRNSNVEGFLNRICTVFPIKLFWHSGFSLRAEAVPPNFRGPTMPVLAARVAGGQVITAKRIGEAAQGVVRNPLSWSDRGTQEQILQELKLLWHVLVKYGTAGT